MPDWYGHLDDFVLDKGFTAVKSDRIQRAACTQSPAKSAGVVGGGAFSSTFLWLGVSSVKMALSRPAHQRVTLAVGR